MAAGSQGTWLLVSVLILNLTGAIRAVKETEVVANVGSKAFLECKSATGLVERCQFTRPNGNILCTDTDEETELLDDIECEEDKSVSLKVNQDTCQLTIPKVANTHLGIWKCVTYNWDYETTDTQIEVRETSGPKRIVEFFQIDEFDVINIAKSQKKEYQCGVFSQSKLNPLKQNPGPMVWKIGSRVMATSDKYEKDAKDNFVQRFSYTPSLSDDKSKLSCSLRSGESTDEVQLTVVNLKSLSKDLPIEVVEADKVITKKFKAVPAPEKFQVYWEVSSSKGTKRVLPGKSDGHFKADLIKKLPNNEFEASITITSPMDLKEVSPDLKLFVQVGPQKRTDSIQIPVKLKFSDFKKSITNEEMKRNDPVVENNDVPEKEDEKDEKDEEVIEKSETKSNNTSIFIIIIIIILVVIVCAVYYCCKCRFNISGQPEPRAQPVRNIKDVEEGKPLVGNSIDQPDGPIPDDSNPKLELAEKDLLAKLDPSPDENEKKIINPESKAKREAFAAAGAKSPPDNDLAVHDEIAKMAEIILSFEKDDLLPKEKDVEQEKVQKAVPIPEDERIRPQNPPASDKKSVNDLPYELFPPKGNQTDATNTLPNNDDTVKKEKVNTDSLPSGNQAESNTNNDEIIKKEKANNVPLPKGKPDEAKKSNSKNDETIQKDKTDTESVSKGELIETKNSKPINDEAIKKEKANTEPLHKAEPKNSKPNNDEMIKEKSNTEISPTEAKNSKPINVKIIKKENSSSDATDVAGSVPITPPPTKKLAMSDEETRGPSKASKPPSLSMPTKSVETKEELPENPSSANSLRSVSTQTPVPHRSFKLLNAANNGTSDTAAADISSDEDSQSQSW